MQLCETVFRLRAGLRLVQDGRFVIAMTQQILGKIQARIGKPARTGHAVDVFDHGASRRARDFAKIPDGTPELGRMFDRVPVKIMVVVDTRIQLGARQVDKPANIGSLSTDWTG